MKQNINYIAVIPTNIQLLISKQEDGDFMIDYICSDKDKYVLEHIVLQADSDKFSNWLNIFHDKITNQLTP